MTPGGVPRPDEGWPSTAWTAAAIDFSPDLVDRLLVEVTSALQAGARQSTIGVRP